MAAVASLRSVREDPGREVQAGQVVARVVPVVARRLPAVVQVARQAIVGRAVQVDLADRVTFAGQVGRATTVDRVDRVGQVTSADPVTTVDRTVATSDRARRTPSLVSATPPGVADRRRGAGERHRGPAGTGLCPPPGGYWNYGPVNYFGYNETPIYDAGFNGWGFYFFGIWIPL